MKYTTYLEKASDLDEVLESGADEVILSCQELSRYGELHLSELEGLALKIREAGRRAVLEWDLLMTEEKFHQKIFLLRKIKSSSFDAIRVQDPGALNWVKREWSECKIQLILEMGNHNTRSVLFWERTAGANLERIVLSSEISKSELPNFKDSLKCEVEFLVLGRILLFYTPRSLLRPLSTQSADENIIHAQGHSEESPHKGFPLIENSHGTFMFGPKDLNITAHLNDLATIGIEWVRFDLRWGRPLSLLKKVKENPSGALDIVKDLYKYPTIKGFFLSNKSDVLFKKLKTRATNERDELFLGDVLDVVKKNHVAIFLKNKERPLMVGDEILYKTPEGKERIHKVLSLKNSKEEECEKIEHGQIAVLPHVSGISVRTVVFLKSNS